MERFHSLHDVCDRLGVTRQTLNRWVRKGSFPAPVQIGERRVAFRASDLAEWEASRPRVQYAAEG